METGTIRLTTTTSPTITGVTNVASNPVMMSHLRNPNVSSTARLLVDPRTGAVLGTINPAQNPPMGMVQKALPTRVAETSYSTARKAATPPKPTPVPPLQKISKPAMVDLTRGAGSHPDAKLLKSFPHLVVSPKPQKTANGLQAKRSELDQKVKGLLVQPQAKFTEWLMKQGLVPGSQTLGTNKLKLAMYNDPKRFPFSGGYVWLGDKNPSKLVSVYKNSVFELSNHSPTVVLKLIYHWALPDLNSGITRYCKIDCIKFQFFFSFYRMLYSG